MAAIVNGGGGGGMSMSAPQNQGQFGQCASYAFTKALVETLRSKYEVSLKFEDVLSKLEYVIDGWNGFYSSEIIPKFNLASEANGKFCFRDQENNLRYYITIKETTRIDSVAEAYAKAQKLDSEMMMVVVIRTSACSTHAIVVDKAYTESNHMRGLNSWGIRNMIMDVHRGNFVYAVVIDPNVLRVKNWRDEIVATPPETKGYCDWRIQNSSGEQKDDDVGSEEAFVNKYRPVLKKLRGMGYTNGGGNLHALRASFAGSGSLVFGDQRHLNHCIDAYGVLMASQ